ncbi:MAG TPA: extracellular solute-binding protein, partial [Anaerolineaceae bacterium]|nr:extracellular solute-binding protein [Anaerolineaceae bacterium]
QTLMFSGDLTDIAVQQRVQTLKKSTDTWLVIPFPSPAGQPVAVVGGPTYAIFQTAPAEQLAAWAFVRWLVEPERQALLAQSAGAYPLSDTATEFMSAYADALPQWAATLAWLDWAQPAPGIASWSSVRHILEDAAWQVIQPGIAPDQIPAVLQELDAMIDQYAH